MEMVATLFKKLINGATKEELMQAGMGGYFSNHETCPFLASADGEHWDSKFTQAKGDPIADLYNDMAAERATL